MSMFSESKIVKKARTQNAIDWNWTRSNLLRIERMWKKEKRGSPGNLKVVIFFFFIISALPFFFLFNYDSAFHCMLPCNVGVASSALLLDRARRCHLLAHHMRYMWSVSSRTVDFLRPIRFSRTLFAHHICTHTYGFSSVRSVGRSKVVCMSFSI